MPVVEAILNSALRERDREPGFLIAFADKWIGIENPKTEKYDIAVLELVRKVVPAESPANPPPEPKPLLYSQIFDQRFAEIVSRQAQSSGQFGCEILAKDSKIMGIRLVDSSSGIAFDVVRKSVLKAAMSPHQSYVVFEPDEPDMIHLLRDVTPDPSLWN